jgi:hypothetical protein
MPTIASSGASAWNLTASTAVYNGISLADGDLLVVLALGANAVAVLSTTAPTNTGTALTYAQRINAPAAADTNVGRAIMWTAQSASSQTINVTCTRPMGTTGSPPWGFQWWVISAGTHNGVGAVASATTGSNTQAITTTADGSMLLGGSSDWNAVDGTSRTRRTVNGSTGTEHSYFRDSAQYTIYTQSYADAGTAGSKTFGYSAPAGQQTTIAVVEILAGGGGGTPTPPILVMQTRRAY